jgi:phenylpyruvate tautomerase PptA (4-oxalocrotonate tautomerase family)
VPHIICNTRAGMDGALKAKVASAITEVVHQTIKSDYYHISVLFNELAPDSIYVAGKPGSDTIIVCNIRVGRSDHAVKTLSQRISDTWHEITGQAEKEIEVAIQEFQGKFVVRGGKPMPDPPFA